MAKDYLSPEELARGALGLSGNTQNTASLAPSAKATDYSSLMPKEYVPYKREEFDWTTPNSEKPSGTEDWNWTRNIKAKQLFDQEQNAAEESAYKKYLTDYNAAKDYVSLAQQQQQQALDNQNTQLTAAGLTPLASLNELPYLQIQQLGEKWQGTTDPTLRNSFNQQALNLAKSYNIVPQDYVGSVNGYIPATVAGTPTAETQYKTDVLNYQKQQDAAQAAAALSKGSGSSSGGGGSGGTKQFADDLYSATIEEMLGGQSRHRKAISAGESRSPHSYNSYVNKAIQMAQQAGSPLSQSQINALLQQANYLAKADMEWSEYRSEGY